MADWNTVRYDPSYEEKLDPEMIPLCDALNVAGFVTTVSCCGHGRSWPMVCFEHSTDERIERMARFVMGREGWDYRPYFSMWQKEICLDGYLWCLEIHLNNCHATTPVDVAIKQAEFALSRVTQAIQAFPAIEAARGPAQ
jgi:hypothetical protein